MRFASLRLVAVFIAVWTGVPLVQADPLTPQQAYDLGATSGGETHRSAIQSGINPSDGAAIVDGYTDAPPQAGGWAGNMTPLGSILGPGVTQDSNCVANVPQGSVSAEQSCEAVRAVHASETNRGAYADLLPPGDPLLLQGDVIQNDPEAYAGAFTETYSECVVTEIENGPQFIYESCDEALISGTMSCAVGNEVTVDDGTLYQCTRTSGALDPGQCSIGDVVTVQPGVEYRCDQTPFRLETVTCRRVLLVSCVTTGINCGNAGIKGGSISGRNLSYGWTASGLNVYTDIGKYERQTHDLYFELENFAQINEFVLTYMGGNVTAGIAVNGHWVVSGGSGISGFHFDPTADRLTLTQSGGLFGTKICWTATNCISNFPDPDGGYWSGAKELMPYMVDGANHIHIVTINGPRKGNYQINFRVKQKCTSICEDNWDNQCAPFEARS